MNDSPEMAFALVSVGKLDVALWLHDAEDPTQARWNLALEKLTALKRKRGGDLSALRTLVLTDGGAPNALQRAQMMEGLFEGRPLKLGAVTTSMSNPVKRGIASILKWLNPNFCTFSPFQMSAALAHLDLPAGTLDTLWIEMVELQRAMRPVQTLRLVGACEGLAPLLQRTG